MGDLDRSALEVLWRKRLNDARLRLDFARSYFREVKQDFASAGVTGPVERFAFDKALHAETAALAEYGRVLAIFNDLIINGKIPNEDDWPLHRTPSEGE